MSGLDAGTLERLLHEHGVAVLTVTSSPIDPRQAHVYLSGNAGRSHQEEAVRFLRGLPGVESVTESPVSWTILVLTLSTEDPPASQS